MLKSKEKVKFLIYYLLENLDTEDEILGLLEHMEEIKSIPKDEYRYENIENLADRVVERLFEE